MTAVAEDEIAGVFEAALAQDAGVPAAPAAPVAPAPPRKPDPAEQADRPRPKPRPAKAKPDERPRTAPVAEVAPLPAGKYAEGLQSSGEMAWLALSMNQGMRLGPVKLPDTRAHAAMFRRHLPALAATWGEAATKNATVRKYVSKVAGDGGGGSWMLGVCFSSAMFAMGCVTLARADNADLRAQLAAQNDQAVQEYMQQMAEALGLDAEGQAA